MNTSIVFPALLGWTGCSSVPLHRSKDDARSGSNSQVRVLSGLMVVESRKISVDIPDAGEGENTDSPIISCTRSPCEKMKSGRHQTMLPHCGERKELRTRRNLCAGLFHPLIKLIQEPLTLYEACHLIGELGAVFFHRHHISSISDPKEAICDVKLATDHYL